LVKGNPRVGQGWKAANNGEVSMVSYHLSFTTHRSPLSSALADVRASAFPNRQLKLIKYEKVS